MLYTVELQNLMIPLCLFTLLATGTPGPNNILLTLSGSQYGFRQTLPFMMGIRFGVIGLFILMGMGIGSLLMANPEWHFSLQLIGACYLGYLAFKIAFSKVDRSRTIQTKVLSFKRGLLLQFVNPKVLMTVSSCVSAFSLPGELYTRSVFQAMFIFTLMGALTNSCWILFGSSLNLLLTNENTQQLFNRIFALLLLFTIGLIFY